MKELWLVGQFRAETRDGNVWDFQGIFDTRAGAICACRDSNYFIAPVQCNVEIGHGVSGWPAVEYPIA